MATRAQVKTWLRNFLSTNIDDPLYGDNPTGVSAVLDPIVQQSVDALIGEIHEQNPHYLSTFASLMADTPTGHLYSLASQTPAVIDFSRWLELRFTDENGSEFEEARLEELHAAGSGYFAVTGPDEAAVVQTSADTTAGSPLWLRYAYWPADLPDDNAVIPGIPKRYHDVVALEALFAFGIGGESVRPLELTERWRNRRSALFAHVGRRGVQQQRTRLDAHAGTYLG